MSAAERFLRATLYAPLEAVVLDTVAGLRRWLGDLPRPPVITLTRRYEDGSMVGRCPSCAAQWSDGAEVHRCG